MQRVIVISVVLLGAAWGERLVGCPFCGPVAEPISRRRDAADVLAIGEATGSAERQKDGSVMQTFFVRTILRGDLEESSAEVDVTEADDAVVLVKVASTVVGTAALLGHRRPGLAWEAIVADEGRLGYILAAPACGAEAVERLRWFATRLEHPDPLIAEDAFAEFAQARFEDVREAADALPAAQLCGWVMESGVDQRRRGFYGLALGLVAMRDADRHDDSIRSLRAAIEEPADDFRGGFDGVLAGLLVAEGEAGLDYLTARGLFEPSARAVEKRQALAALRFAWESLGDSIPRQRIAVATTRLLASPATAAEAIVDLARYGWWESVDEVAELWPTLGEQDPLIRRAVAGYLAACPLPEAVRRLAVIRAADAEQLEAALESARLPLGR